LSIFSDEGIDPSDQGLNTTRYEYEQTSQKICFYVLSQEKAFYLAQLIDTIVAFAEHPSIAF
jgi:hypothetical protein